MKLVKAFSVILAIGLLATALSSREVFAKDHILVNNTVDSFLGLQNLEYSYKATENLTIGVVGVHSSQAKQNSIELIGNSVGGIARFYFGEAFEDDAWFVTASAHKSNFTASIYSDGSLYSGKSGNSTVVGAGYHWFWNSFNLSLGLSLANNSKISLTNSSGNRYKDEINPHTGIELKMGGSL